MREIKLYFPLNMEPDVLIGNAIYSKEAYKSVLEQLKEGVPVYASFDSDTPRIGESIDVIDSKVIISIDNPIFIAELDCSKDALCMSVSMKADTEPNADNVEVAHTVTLKHLSILRKKDIPMLLAIARERDRNVAVLKEKTLDLESDPFPDFCNKGCVGDCSTCEEYIKCENPETKQVSEDGK